MIEDWAADEKKPIDNNETADDEKQEDNRRGQDEDSLRPADVDKEEELSNNEDADAAGQVLDEPGKAAELKEDALQKEEPDLLNKNKETELVVDEMTEKQETAKSAEKENAIKPFPPMTAKIQTGANQTLDFLDLWRDDANCTKVFDHLLSCTLNSNSCSSNSSFKSTCWKSTVLKRGL